MRRRMCNGGLPIRRWAGRMNGEFRIEDGIAVEKGKNDGIYIHITCHKDISFPLGERYVLPYVAKCGTIDLRIIIKR